MRYDMRWYCAVVAAHSYQTKFIALVFVFAVFVCVRASSTIVYTDPDYELSMCAKIQIFDLYERQQRWQRQRQRQL